MRYLFIALAFICGRAALAQQSDCLTKLYLAQELDQEARFGEVLQLIEGCLKAEGLQAGERARMVFLLRRACNALGMFEKAEAIRQYAFEDGIEELPDSRFDVEEKARAMERYRSVREAISLAQADLNAQPERTAMRLEALLDSVRMGPSLRVEALELLVEAYLMEGLPERADTAFKKIFPIHPQYEPGSERSLNYRQFAGRYASEPRFSFALTGGVHITQPYVIRQFSPNMVSIGSERYRYLYDPQLELQLSYHPNRATECLLGLGYRWDSYDYQGNYRNALAPDGSRQNAKFVFSEGMRSMKASFSFRYNFFTLPEGIESSALLALEERPLADIWKRITPFFTAGISVQRLNRSFMSRPAIDFGGGAIPGIGEDQIVLANRPKFTKSLTGPAGLPLRQNASFTLLAGGGLKLYANRVYYFLEAFYGWTPTNIVATENREANPDLINKYNYLDNDIHLHQLYFSLGIGYSIFYTVVKR